MQGDIEAVVAALNAAQVRYLIVGGVAVVLHGHLRTTMDVDLVIQLKPQNVDNALRALEKLGYQPVAPVPLLDFADPAKRTSWVREKNMIVFSLWLPERPVMKVDIFAAEPFDFDSTYRRAVRVDLGATKATVVAREDLIALKRQAGRAQDLADVEALVRAHRKEGRTP